MRAFMEQRFTPKKTRTEKQQAADKARSEKATKARKKKREWKARTR